jgi:hypothetical protein
MSQFLHRICDLQFSFPSSDFIFISRINHACTPNAVWSWTSGNIRKKPAKILVQSKSYLRRLGRRYTVGTTVLEFVNNVWGLGTE